MVKRQSIHRVDQCKMSKDKMKNTVCLLEPPRMVAQEPSPDGVPRTCTSENILACLTTPNRDERAHKLCTNSVHGWQVNFLEEKLSKANQRVIEMGSDSERKKHTEILNVE